MAHPETPEAVDAPVSYDEASAATELSKLFLSSDAEEEQQDTEEQAVEPQDGELDLSEEQEDEESEPEAPAIAPPVSLNAEEKAVFAQLPKEAQEAWSASETRRNAQVQEATTKASEAQRVAEAKAAQADAEAKARYAMQLEEVGKAFMPPEPDRSWYADDVSYLTACREYDRQAAQHGEFMQRVADLKTEADREAQAAFIAQRDRELLTIPEISNPETRSDYLERAMKTADMLGFDRMELAEGMTARDVKALSLVADLAEKASKYDKAIARQMQKVREGKTRTLRPNAAQPEGSGRNRAFSEANQRLRQSGSVDDAAAAIRAMMG